MNRKTGVILSYSLMIFEILSTLLLTPLIIRTLGRAEYGVYILISSITAYLLLLDLGIGNAVIRYIAKFRISNDQLQSKRFLGIASLYYAFIAIVVLIIGIIFIDLFPNIFARGLNAEETLLGQKLLGITVINAAVMLGSSAYVNVIIAYERFGISRISSIIQIIFRMILVFIALKMNMGSLGIVFVNLLATVIFRAFFVLYVLFKINLRPQLKGVQWIFVREIALYSSLILVQMIATQINSSMGQILLGTMITSSAVIIGIYSIGTQVVQYFQSIGSVFNGVLMPGIVKMVEQKATPQELTNEMIRIGRIIFIVLAIIWGGFLINGKDFLILWAGIENQEAYKVTIILMFAYMFILTQSIGSQILWAMNKHKEQTWTKMVIVVLNVIFTIFLIHWNPLLGAVMGTFISLILGDLCVMNFIFHKNLNMNISYYYKGLFKGILPCIILTICVGIIPNKILPFGWFSFLINIGLMVIIYAFLLFFIGMNTYEKNLVRSFISKYRFPHQ